jgi:anti-sigma factor RsiW
MTCHDYDLLLGDYVDGTLAGEDLARVTAHVPGCARCRAVVADFNVIRSRARTLDVHIPPPAVWAAVSAVVGDGRPWWRRLPLGGPAWRPLGASAFAIVLATGLWAMGNRLAQVGPPAGALAPSGVEAGSPESSLRTAEAEYSSAIAGLEQLAAADRETLDPQTADAIQANLSVIDKAIGESRVALAQEPESELARASLFEALRHKVGLLQDTLALVNEMRKGNQESAARIASGLRQ